MSLYYISKVRFIIAFTTSSLQIDMSIYVTLNTFAIKQLNLSINYHIPQTNATSYELRVPAEDGQWRSIHLKHIEEKFPTVGSSRWIRRYVLP